MADVLITPATAGWQDIIAEHLGLGENAHVRFERPTMSVSEMAATIGISRQAISRRINEGQITTERRGNRHRIPVGEVDRFRAWYLGDIAAASANDW